MTINIEAWCEMSVQPDQSGYGDIDTVAAHLAGVAQRLDELEPNDQLRLLKALGQAADAFMEIHHIFADEDPVSAPVALKPVRNTVVAASLADFAPSHEDGAEPVESDATTPPDSQTTTTIAEELTGSSADLLSGHVEPEQVSETEPEHTDDLIDTSAAVTMSAAEAGTPNPIIEQIAVEAVENGRSVVARDHKAATSLASSREQQVLMYFQANPGREIRPKEVHPFIDPEGRMSRASLTVRTHEILCAIASKTGRLRASGAGSGRRYWLEVEGEASTVEARSATDTPGADETNINNVASLPAGAGAEEIAEAAETLEKDALTDWGLRLDDSTATLEAFIKDKNILGQSFNSGTAGPGWSERWCFKLAAAPI